MLNNSSSSSTSSSSSPIIGKKESIQQRHYFGEYSSTNTFIPKKKKQSNHLPTNSISSSHCYFWEKNEIVELKTIPKYYPLECTHRTIPFGQQKEVIQNLRNCFRNLGIQVIERSSGAALLTMEYIEMYLYFWKSRDDREIYIELQRRQGDSILYHTKYAKPILKAAILSCGEKETNLSSLQNNNAPKERKYPHSSSTNFLLLPGYGNLDATIIKNEPNNLYSYPLDDNLASISSVAEESIEFAMNLLKSDRFDSQMLGMESLCMLTDRRKTNGAIAIYASRAIIFGRNQFLHNLVFKMVLLQEEQRQEEEEKNTTQNNDNENSNIFFHNMRDYYDDDKEEDHFSNAVVILRNHALTILSNGWEVIYCYYYHQQQQHFTDEIENNIEKTIGNLSDGQFCCETDTKLMEVQQQKTEESTSILKTLWNDLAYALHQPHNACLAAKILIFRLRFSLLSNDNNDNNQQKQALGNKYENGKQYHILQQAKNIGIATNARLEQLCHKLQEVLEDTTYQPNN